MKENRDKIRIVLVGTTHPGNIGATARAMKTMAQENLYLVNPKVFPSAEATARATGADDVLANAKVCTDLKEAISDCDLVVGTSARIRSIPWPLVTPRKLAKKITEASYSSIAIVFGRESSGLSNNELELCNLVLQIPSNSGYNSLNLAAAVQIICYELFVLTEKGNNQNNCNDEILVNNEQMEHLYLHFENCMTKIQFLDKENPGKLMHRIRRLFNRAQLDETEWKILMGFLSKIDEKNSDR